MEMAGGGETRAVEVKGGAFRVTRRERIISDLKRGGRTSRRAPTKWPGLVLGDSRLEKKDGPGRYSVYSSLRRGGTGDSNQFTGEGSFGAGG